MITFKPIDGRCPVCDEEIIDVRCDFGVTEPMPCSCGWGHGEHVLICNHCREVVDALIDLADGREVCTECAAGEELADIPTEEVVMA